MFIHRASEAQEEEPLSKKIDLTLLDPRAIDRDVHTLVNMAVKNGYFSVCVNPTLVRAAKEYIEEKIHLPIMVVSVIGFPLGANSVHIKTSEAKEAIKNGADELDVVINLGKLKEGDFGYIKNELSRIVRISKGRIVKAIIETCYLTREEMKGVCKACAKARVDYIQTSTGYGTGGATNEDVQLLREFSGGKCAVKAAGGIRTRAQAEELIRAGAERIGTSKVI